MQNKSLYIGNCDAKDLFIASQYTNTRRRKTGYSLKKRNSDYNLRRFYAALDFSLDQIKLREVYEQVYGKTDFSFRSGRKNYTTRVINVTFKYAVREWNHIGGTTYVKLGCCERDMKFENGACVVDGKLCGIMLNRPIEGDPLQPEILLPYYAFRDGHYVEIKKPKIVKTTAEAREYLYENGFWCDGVHYVRWKRSSGSARVGKCLFIDARLYGPMHEWEMCGLSFANGENVDLAALESYLSLPTSSIVDVLELSPRNILVIDDYESVFSDYVISVEERDGKLVAERKECEIKNSIWDGQGLIDVSAMGRFAENGMVLLRNLFFKCCCFNCNLQKWFADNGITELSQLRGKTSAESLDEIKLITTPSSIKYLKFGSLEQWLEHIEPMFGVVKHEKKTHFFDGRMVQTHYQLLNTLQMTRPEVDVFLAPTFDYMSKIRNDPAVLRYHIKYPISDQDEIVPAQSKNDIVYKMLGITDKFAETKLYYDFKTEILKSFTKNLKVGHVLVNGNYSTLCGNPIEMLLASVGRFDGHSRIGVGNIHSTRFAYNQRLVGSRSPHITCSNVWTPWNRANEEIDTYMNPTPEIVYINSIGDNVLNRLSGCD